MDENLALKASGAETSSHQAEAGVDFGGSDLQPLTYRLTVTAVTGTGPTLDVKIQESDNNSTFHDFLAFAQINAVGVYYVTGKSSSRYRRHYSTLAGTSPNFTYQIDVEPGGRYTNF